MAVGNPDSHSAAHVGARLAPLEPCWFFSSANKLELTAALNPALIRCLRLNDRRQRDRNPRWVHSSVALAPTIASVAFA